MKEFYENQHILNLQAYYIPTYLDFSHADLENADFSQSKKTHMPRTCCTYLFFTVKVPSISFYPDFTLILFVIGLYVFKSVYGHYVVGPTNVPQDSKEDRGCDVDNVADMKNHIFSYFPGYLYKYII